jgi:hypothetical protein
MDFSNFKTPDWLMIGGGIGIFVFGFFKWVTVSGFGFSASGGNVFDFFWTGTIPWILVLGSAVVAFLLAQGTLKQDQLPWPLILLAATGLASLLLLIRIIFNPLDGKDIIESAGGDVGRGVGMILSVLSGLVATAGAYLNFQAAGGTLKDLTDLDKLTSSFAKGDSGAGDPPPPTPPAAPPAPPTDENPPPPPAPPAG